MKPVNLIVTLTLLFLFSCDEEPSIIDEIPVEATGPIELTGVIIDEASQEPLENVEIIGFNRGLSQGNQPVRYGEKISLGTTDKCGQFKIPLPDSIKGFVSHGWRDSTIVILRLSRPDFGEKEVTIPFKAGTQTFSLKYAPIRKGFFKLLYLVQSEDGKSVHIGWNIPSLVYSRHCNNQWDYCSDTSDGNLHIQRSDSAGYNRYVIPIEVNTDQMVTDGDLPPHGNFTYASFTYFIFAGVQFGGSDGYTATIGRTNSDTLFLIKPPEFPTLNHCN